jgi:dTDP-4-amino-4,6-dideoxy-D-galactose acyltransferase
MSSATRLSESIAVTSLDWDTNHFGFQVGRVASELTDAELKAALSEARTRGYRLLYWATSPDRMPSIRLLDEFGGRLVDRKVAFARPLSAADQPRKPSTVTILPHAGSDHSSELSALAVAAGAYSRFAIDPCIPRDKFERLYAIWIERSVRGEIADAVLVARDNPAMGPLAGMITVKVAEGIGNIGLVAVAASHRGRGIGSQLMDAAHRWMIDRGAAKTTVVTQAVNAPACRLYERAGYTIEQAENLYHFWLAVSSSTRAA